MTGPNPENARNSNAADHDARDPNRHDAARRPPTASTGSSSSDSEPEDDPLVVGIVPIDEPLPRELVLTAVRKCLPQCLESSAVPADY